MTHEITFRRMRDLSGFEGTISIEGEGDEQEIVVRIPMFHNQAADVYYKLGNLEED